MGSLLSTVGLRRDQGGRRKGHTGIGADRFEWSGMEDDGSKCKDRQVVSLYVLNLYVLSRGRNKTGDES